MAGPLPGRMHLVRDPRKVHGLPVLLRQRRGPAQPVRLADCNQGDPVEDVHHLCGLDVHPGCSGVLFLPRDQEEDCKFTFVFPFLSLLPTSCSPLSFSFTLQGARASQGTMSVIYVRWREQWDYHKGADACISKQYSSRNSTRSSRPGTLSSTPFNSIPSQSPRTRPSWRSTRTRVKSNLALEGLSFRPAGCK